MDAQQANLRQSINLNAIQHTPYSFSIYEFIVIPIKWRRGPTLRLGAIPQISALHPHPQMWHIVCRTKSISILGVKRSVLWPSKYAKMRFRPGSCRGSSLRSTDPLIGWEGTLPHILPHSNGGNAPTKYFFSVTVPEYVHGYGDHRITYARIWVALFLQKETGPC